MTKAYFVEDIGPDDIDLGIAAPPYYPYIVAIGWTETTSLRKGADLLLVTENDISRRFSFIDLPDVIDAGADRRRIVEELEKMDVAQLADVPEIREPVPIFWG